MVTRTCDPSIQEVEAGRSGVQGQLQLHSKLPATEDPSKPGVVAHACNLSTHEAEAGGS